MDGLRLLYARRDTCTPLPVGAVANVATTRCLPRVSTTDDVRLRFALPHLRYCRLGSQTLPQLPCRITPPRLLRYFYYYVVGCLRVPYLPYILAALLPRWFHAAFSTRCCRPLITYVCCRRNIILFFTPACRYLPLTRAPTAALYLGFRFDMPVLV